MELREYVGAKRLWLVPLIVVPLIAGGVTAFLLEQQPPTSEAQVRIQVPPDSNNSDSQIGLYVAKLAEALRVDVIERQVVEASGVAADELAEGLSVGRQGQSDQIVLTLATTSGDQQTLLAAEVAAQASLNYLVTRSAASVEQTLESAQAAFTQAQQALFAYQDEIGVLDPPAALQQVTGALRSAQGDLVADRAVGDSVGAARAQAEVNLLTAQQTELVPQVRAFAELQAAVEAAREALADAQRDFTQYQARVATAGSGEQIVESAVDREASGLIEGVGLAVVVAFLAVLGLSVVPDAFRAQRPRHRLSLREQRTSALGDSRPGRGREDEGSPGGDENGDESPTAQELVEAGQGAGSGTKKPRS